MLFGYTEEEVLRIFHEKQEQERATKRVTRNKSALAELQKASRQMVKEDAEYLAEAYAPLNISSESSG